MDKQIKQYFFYTGMFMGFSLILFMMFFNEDIRYLVKFPFMVSLLGLIWGIIMIKYYEKKQKINSDLK